MLVSLFLLEIGLYFILEFHSANFSWSIGTHAREAVIPVGIKKWRREMDSTRAKRSEREHRRPLVEKRKATH